MGQQQNRHHAERARHPTLHPALAEPQQESPVSKKLYNMGHMAENLFVRLKDWRPISISWLSLLTLGKHWRTPTEST